MRHDHAPRAAIGSSEDAEPEEQLAEGTPDVPDDQDEDDEAAVA